MGDRHVSAAGAAASDLFRVNLRTGIVTVATAELADVAALDVVLGADTDDALVATPRGVYLATRFALREMLDLASHETVTDMALGAISCVFVRGAEGRGWCWGNSKRPSRFGPQGMRR